MIYKGNVKKMTWNYKVGLRVESSFIFLPILKESRSGQTEPSAGAVEFHYKITDAKLVICSFLHGKLSYIQIVLAVEV